MMKDLSYIEKKLESMAKKGHFDCSIGKASNELPDVVPESLSDEDRAFFLETVKKASWENAIVEASRKIQKTELPFGRHLQSIRDKSGLGRMEIAKLLGKPVSYIEDIENGLVNPITMFVDEIINIMQLFRLTLSGLENTCRAFLLFSKVSNKGVVMARSPLKTGTKERGDNLGHAMDAALLAIAKKNDAKNDEGLQVLRSFLKSVQKSLKDKGVKDLLV